MSKLNDKMNEKDSSKEFGKDTTKPLPKVSDKGADTNAEPLPLSEKEKAVLQFIESKLSASGVSPSYQEIKDHFGFASFNSVQNYLKQLTSKGYIRIPENQKRAIQILHSAQAVQTKVQSIVKRPYSEPSHSHQLLQKSDSREEVLSLPLLGKVAAGRPIESFEHNEFVDVPPSMVRNPSKTFALKVSGSSMIDDGIFDNDIILVQKQSTAINGEIIVASVDNESTVKRYFLKPKPKGHEGPDKMIELRPANSTMESFWYSPDQVDVQGVVVGLLRKFQ